MSQVTFNQLLDDVPLYTPVDVSGFLCDITVKRQEQNKGLAALEQRKIVEKTTQLSGKLQPSLYCGSDGCNNYTYFEMLSTTQQHLDLNCPSINRVAFRCCNCKQKSYEFYLEITPTVNGNANNDTIFRIQKVGQQPRHGKAIPKKASKLIGKERNLFFKGSISENQGMGIGAFSYYRRVIDSQKDKIFDEIIKVLNLTTGNETLIQELTDAKAETQFTKAVDKIKTALPDGLKISGYDPLKLLYQALSEGLHNHTDEECLENAHDIKLVLFQFSERLDSALKDDAELTSAINRLARKGR
ncbi:MULTISPECIES: hypothetical protein [unclassified Colwellia]|uniref:hypothetical protein n=1 Tax=unclassified Colwellia TaxID=196834 RepID=UPI0015F478BA|nr:MULTISPECIES: hypothetical protein [unclassified Colwellia]MBA6379544.1 hypothetical protein [Colwellia sp. BRX10-7]MBA6386141.1 hypothetical protein [Colwellia sp. BRX10-2]MBA6403274.1 hypothetical protein [Colwellia sp. BRX10-5]MBA6405868.1 hypothetical protein [Colwellia sp. BRX10-1]